MLIREARAVDAAAIARVHVDSWRTTYAGILPSDFLASLSYEEREQSWSRTLSAPDGRSFTCVAEDGEGRIVGFASGGREREGDPTYRGELYAIYVLAQCQRRGIGSRLTAAVVRRLVEQDIDSMLLWVLAGNPSRGFYENLGARRIREKPAKVGGIEVIEVAYGWSNLQSLSDLGA